MAQHILTTLKARFGEAILSTHSSHGDDTAHLSPESLVAVCAFLRDDPAMAFDLCMDITGVDYLGDDLRFEVVYHLYSVTKKHRVRLKVRLPDETPTVASVVSVWKGANWFEREAWDLYGIRFEGHPDLRRILLYDQFVGHPLRKDYPKERRQPLVRRDPSA